MAMTYKPYDIGIWFENIDVNSLTDNENAQIEHVDIENDNDLKWLVCEWIRPRYMKWSEQNRKEMRDILEQSDNWRRNELQSVAGEFHMPSGQQINDVDRFISALKEEFLK